jgi:hypothetical protein
LIEEIYVSDPREMQRSLTSDVVAHGANSWGAQERYYDELEREVIEQELCEWEGLAGE